jgi:hypothetical protein
MNKFKFYFILTITTVLLFSCTKKDTLVDVPVTPPRVYATQYATDIADIEDYLKTNYITVVDKPGMPEDQDVTITKIPDGGTQKSILSYLNATTFPKLLFREVPLHGIIYKLYYLVLRQGTGESPMNTDGVFTAYSGQSLSKTVATATVPSTITATEFETVTKPQFIDFFKINIFFQTERVIRGWQEVFPQFKTGLSETNTDGTIKYSNFGAGVMFIPSGLGYYNNAKTNIPAYSPMVFSFKLYALKRLDHEYYNAQTSQGIQAISIPDGVFDYQEDINQDGYVWFKEDLQTGADNLDDTDKDGIPDFLDADDDGDSFSTKLEISKGTKYLDKNSHP